MVETSDEIDIGGAYFLVISHVAFLPSVWFTFRNQMYGVSAQLLVMTFVSTIYHLTQNHFIEKLFGKDSEWWAHRDLLFAGWAFIIALVLVLRFDSATRRFEWHLILLVSFLFLWDLNPGGLIDVIQIAWIVSAIMMFACEVWVWKTPYTIGKNLVYIAVRFGILAATSQSIALFLFTSPSARDGLLSRIAASA